MKTGLGRAFGRREFLKASALVGGAALALPGVTARAAGSNINLQTWSAAVDLVKSHVAAFEKKTGLTVDYANAPWAQYPDAMVTKFAGGAPLDVLWVSDGWLPQWAEANWIAPIDGFDNLMAYNGDAEPFCTDSMTYNGRQYGLTYYTDYMGFLYDAEKLSAAGFSAPPTSWDEVVEQSLVMKQKGLSDFPLMLALAKESWLIEFMSAMVFSQGGAFTDDKGNSVMQEAKGGALTTLQWIVDAVNKHKIVSSACLETGELNGLKAFAAGNHAFALLPKYRLAMLNDPAQSKIAGRAKQALMPQGKDGSHATVGWMRFHGMSTQAAADKARAENAAKLIEWFGGKADGEYKFQKLLFLDLGSSFGVKPLFQDADVRAAYNKYGDVELIQKQQALARKKDVITPWFGDWNEVNGSAWQSAVLGNASAADALKKSGKEWDDLKSQS
ncbi:MULTISPECIES: extracellular solute-binding protein [Rhizobium/Agrobacterium group]|uniref:Extracellular solute-binding protein n=2 Tax=Neorhizobium TaxID=1525371 RepID=A0ABV0M5G9_9HYPH|nr:MULTISPECIES: extracellular solute-binding protein [Rhizobium/Agrobacterium group]KGD99602.1 sugar ABC transporter substrate-binding protein [Rhizobium sp. YS-1r]MCC2609479.1 extracellular solute-binding protein [Neorhizobium petrolearium]WGI69688.1 extracellular solute-binding protein [Neorhizobium petrolearium]